MGGVVRERVTRVLSLVAGALLTGAIGAAQVTHYRVGPQDVLAVSVYGQLDLTGKFTVEADGTFTYPLIGRVAVGGLSLRDIEQLIRTKLADGYLRNPQVSVAVDEYRSQRVFVIGEIRMPNTYALTGDMSLIEMLSKAGSTTENASSQVLIVRPRDGRAVDGPTLPGPDSEVIEIDVTALQAGQFDQNAALRHNDTIIVPRADRVFVLGQVKNPGPYPLQKGMTVLQALALAGGVTDRGSDSRIRIRRQEAGRLTEVKAKFDDPVRAGDSIVVLERFW